VRQLPISRHRCARRSRQATVLARGVWITTERRGNLVLRQPNWWCPAPLGRLVLRTLLNGARRFGSVLPVSPVRLVRRGSSAVLVQRYVSAARPLRRLTVNELANPYTRLAICRFWAAVERCWQETGWLPDVGGRVYFPWELYVPLRTDNVVLDTSGECWLVDVGATAIFHCARWPTARLHAALMLGAIRRCSVALDCANAAAGYGVIL